MSKQNTSPFFIGVIICLLGAICFSTKAIFVKLAYRDTAVDAVSLLALRMIFSLPFFLVSAGVYSSKENNVKFTNKQWIYVFIYPTLVLLMNSVLFKQKIKPIQWLAVILTYAGLLLAFFSEVDIDSSQNENFLWGSFLIFVCAFTYAAYIVGSGKLIPMVGAIKFNSYAMSFACVGVLLHFFVTSEQSLIELPAKVYTYSFLMAILSTVIPSYLVTLGIKRIGSDTAAIVGSVGPVSTILLAYFFLNESIFAMQIVGTLMILFGVLLVSRGKGEVV